MSLKTRLGKEYFYSTIISFLKRSTNLTKLQKKLNISKQNLNYYLREMVKFGYIEKKGIGWYEVKKQLDSSKKTTKYDKQLVKDMTRGHAYVWNIYLEKKPRDWQNRLEIIKKKKVNHKLVGALKTTPRIKVMGRKVWLCNDHIRIFDIEKASYYGNNAKESREKSTMKLYEIVKALENKLGFLIKPFNFEVRKEHYALIKNDLAIHHNKKGIIMRIEDEDGEWLLIDDSLGQGGELETVGKKAYKNNKPLQNWWNIKKKHNFSVTDDFILQNIKTTKEQIEEISKSLKESSTKQLDTAMIIKQMDANIRGLTETVYQLTREMKR
jgi:hypothetical protein